MKIHLPRDILLVPDLDLHGEKTEQIRELEDWASQLCRSLEEYFRKAYYDVRMGTSTFKVFTSEPTTSDLAEGQLGLYGGYVYAMMNSTLYRTAMETPNSKNLICRITVS